ncbi:hypothetical protein ACFX2I_013647 [Malus domestica]
MRLLPQNTDFNFPDAFYSYDRRFILVMLVAGVEEGVVVVRVERNGAEGVGKDCEVGFEVALEKLVEKPKEDCKAEEARVPKEENLETVIDGGAAVVGAEVVGFKREEDVGNVKAEKEVEKLWNHWVVRAIEDDGWDEEVVPDSGEEDEGWDEEHVPNNGEGALGANEVAPNEDEVAEEEASNRGETDAVKVVAGAEDMNGEVQEPEQNKEGGLEKKKWKWIGRKRKKRKSQWWTWWQVWRI